MQPLERVNAADDPRRCQGVSASGQCKNVAVEGQNLCEICSRGTLVEKNRQQYLLTNPNFQSRLLELSNSDGIKSLLDEVSIAKILIAEQLNTIKPGQDTSSICGSVNALLLTVEKLTSRSHILAQNLGHLYHRSTIVQMMQAFVGIVDEEVRPLEGGIEAIDKIVARVYEYAQQARNTEQARGMKLLENGGVN